MGLETAATLVSMESGANNLDSGAMSVYILEGRSEMCTQHHSRTDGALPFFS